MTGDMREPPTPRVGARGGLSRRSFLRRLLSAAGLSALASSARARGDGEERRERRPAGPVSDQRVIVLGFDGADPGLVGPWMDEGKLPNLARLRREGCYRSMLSSNPAESPVAWSAFACGANPGQTAIFDFLRRKPGTYNPEYALVGEGEMPLLQSSVLRAGIALGALLPGGLVGGVMKLATRRRLWGWVSFAATTVVLACGAALALFRWLPRKLPLPVARRKGKAFWELLDEAGYRTSCIRIPVAFPPPELRNGRILSGLSVPDVRKTQGTFSYYTSAPGSAADTEAGGKIIPVSIENGRARSSIIGPRNFTREERPDVTVPFEMSIDGTSGTVTVTVQGRSQTLSPGQWSDWFEIKFPLNPIISLWGMVKFYLSSVEPEFRLYLSPVNFHPHRLPLTVRLSHPPGFVGELARRVGLFKTLGWDCPTMPLKDGWLEEEPFLVDSFDTMDTKWRLVESELQCGDWDCLVGVFETTDRIQHMLWWTLDPRHPVYDSALAEKFAGAILEVYQRMDTIVGRVLENYVDEDTTLIVMSDHGFASFRRGVNINTWLAKEGFLTLKPEESEGGRHWSLEDLFGDSEFFEHVHWPKTRAYSIGLGQIYINLIGREPKGAVKPGEEYRRVKREIREKFRTLRDPDTGEPVVVEVYDRDDIYHGPYFDEAPDLVVGFEPGYRVSWQTCLGGVPRGNVVDNPEKWSGDHCSIDPRRIPGILFSNRTFQQTSPRIFDIAPTVLELFGVPVPEAMDGKPLGLQGRTGPHSGSVTT